jgi:hypothetical protein
MKNITTLLTAMIISGAMFAQTNTKKGLKKVSCGVVVPIFSSTPITYPIKTFTTGYNVLPNVVFITERTYHNFLYGTGNNVFRTINGYKIKQDVGIYTALQKSLRGKNYYGGIGIEKFIPVHQNLTFFLFSEIGINIVPHKKTGAFTIGMHMNIQTPLWKQK